MIRLIELVVGARREAKEQTRRICRVVLDGEPRGRLSLTLREADQLAALLATAGKLTIDK